MADHKGGKFQGLIVLLLTLAMFNSLTNAQPLISRQSIVKSIKFDNDDVVDCVEIHGQPAFLHPRLRDHIIQMKPSSYPKLPKGYIEENRTRKAPTFGIWTNSAECPEGTIPILRNENEQIYPRRPKTLPRRVKHNDVNSIDYEEDLDDLSGYEYATVRANNGTYYGAHASINLWHPRSNPDEHTLAQIWVASTQPPVNTIEAGWEVSSDPSLSKEPRLFTYWTADDYRHSGCENLDCPGFVQVNRRVVLGGVLRPISVYDGPQQEIEMTIFRDNATGNWWLRVDGEDVGYFPGNIFSNNLRYSADEVTWGGEINNFPPPGGHHTTTQMGSGHFPNEGYGRSSYFRNVLPITQPESTPDNVSLSEIVSRDECYSLQQGRNETGIYFYFGGPGYSAQCGSANTNNILGGVRSSIGLLAIVIGIILFA